MGWDVIGASVVTGGLLIVQGVVQHKSAVSRAQEQRSNDLDDQARERLRGAHVAFLACLDEAWGPLILYLNGEESGGAPAVTFDELLPSGRQAEALRALASVEVNCSTESAARGRRAWLFVQRVAIAIPKRQKGTALNLESPRHIIEGYEEVRTGYTASIQADLAMDSR